MKTGSGPRRSCKSAWREITLLWKEPAWVKGSLLCISSFSNMWWQCYWDAYANDSLENLSGRCARRLRFFTGTLICVSSSETRLHAWHPDPTHLHCLIWKIEKQKHQMVPERGQAEVSKLTPWGLSNSSFISPQLRQTKHNEDKQSKLCFFLQLEVVWHSPPRPSKLGRHEGCAAWGKQVPKGSFPPFSCLTLRPISQLLFIQAVEKGGDGERVVYTSQLETDRTFYNPQRRACEKTPELVQVS